MSETYHDKIQLYFSGENLQSHFMDTDSFVLSVHTKNTINGLKSWRLV